MVRIAVHTGELTVNFVPSKLECWSEVGQLAQARLTDVSEETEASACKEGLRRARRLLSEEFARRAFEKGLDFNATKQDFERAWRQVKYLFETRYGLRKVTSACLDLGFL